MWARDGIGRDCYRAAEASGSAGCKRFGVSFFSVLYPACILPMDARYREEEGEEGEEEEEAMYKKV